MIRKYKLTIPLVSKVLSSNHLLNYIDFPSFERP